MQKEDATIADIKLEIKDPDLKLLNTILYTKKNNFMSFLDIIKFTKKSFFEKLRSYEQFGRSNYSDLKFGYLKIISCNGGAVRNVNDILPKELCQIVIEAKGKQKNLVNAKYLKIADRSERTKMRERNHAKNIENRQHKLRLKFGPDYSLKKFNKLKLLKEKTLVNKSRKSKKSIRMNSSHPYNVGHCEPYCHRDTDI